MTREQDPPDEMLPDGRMIPAHGTQRRYKHRTYPCHCALCRAAHNQATIEARRRAMARSGRVMLGNKYVGSPVTGWIGIKVEKELAEGINAEMERYGVTKTEMVKRLLREALERREYLRDKGEST